jgi:hypothetical protein
MDAVAVGAVCGPSRTMVDRDGTGEGWNVRR